MTKQNQTKNPPSVWYGGLEVLGNNRYRLHLTIERDYHHSDEDCCVTVDFNKPYEEGIAKPLYSAIASQGKDVFSVKRDFGTWKAYDEWQDNRLVWDLFSFIEEEFAENPDGYDAKDKPSYSKEFLYRMGQDDDYIEVKYDDLIENKKDKTLFILQFSVGKDTWHFNCTDCRFKKDDPHKYFFINAVTQSASMQDFNEKFKMMGHKVWTKFIKQIEDEILAIYQEGIKS